MSNPISRRSFLKCGGAAVLAVGAAGMLSGCDLVDSVIGSVIEQVSGASGIDTKKMGGSDTDFATVCALNSTWWYKDYTDHSELTVVGVKIEIKNYQNKDLVFDANGFSAIKIDGCDATIVTNTAEELKDKEDINNYPSTFANGSSVTYAADKNFGAPKTGWVFFRLGEKKPQAKEWTNMQFKLALNGDTAEFTLNRSNGNFTSSIK